MTDQGVAFLGACHPHFDGRAQSLKRIAGVQLVLGHDPHEQHRARLAAHGIKLATMEQILDDPHVQLVVIEGENPFCADAALRCAQFKKPFLLEKPGAHNLATLKRVAAAARERQVPHQVGYHMRFAPSVTRARALLERGLLGEITLARAHVSAPGPWLEDFWFTRPEDRGGLVYLDACHMIDLMIVLLGKPERATGRLLKRKPSTIPFEDGAAAILEYPGLLATLDVTGWEANDWVETWEIDIFGTEGTLKIGVHPPWLELYLKSARDELPRGWSMYRDPTFPGERNYQLELEAFLAALPGGASRAACSLAQAVDVAEVIEQIYVTAGK